MDELAHLDFLRALRDALSGHSQREVARALGISQPAVCKLAATADSIGECRPGFSGASITEIIARYHADQLTREQVTFELGHWEYEPLRWEPSSVVDDFAPFEPGTWQEIDKALGNGQIDDDIYKAAYRTHFQRLKRRQSNANPA
jgi:hypothetical protein